MTELAKCMGTRGKLMGITVLLPAGVFKKSHEKYGLVQGKDTEKLKIQNQKRNRK